MRYGRSIGLIAACVLLATSAFAHDETKYPDWRAQWVRAESAQFDPSKPGGRGQQAPLTPEYQAKLDEILANRARGSLEGNFTVTCLPTGMPRMMIVYETMDIIVLPEMTYIRMTLMNELRRIHTDGRTWPTKADAELFRHLDRAVVGRGRRRPLRHAHGRDPRHEGAAHLRGHARHSAAQRQPDHRQGAHLSRQERPSICCATRSR